MSSQALTLEDVLSCAVSLIDESNAVVGSTYRVEGALTGPIGAQPTRAESPMPEGYIGQLMDALGYIRGNLEEAKSTLYRIEDRIESPKPTAPSNPLPMPVNGMAEAGFRAHAGRNTR